MNLIRKEEVFPRNRCQSYSLLLGVICGDHLQIQGLLEDIFKLGHYTYLSKVDVVILGNGCNNSQLEKQLLRLNQQAQNSTYTLLTHPGPGIISIGRARSILQKKLGHKMKAQEVDCVWILDDDMRIPPVAEKYLTWIPEIKKQKVDVLIGSFTGGSPNPASHGLRVQVLDVLENLKVMATLAPNDVWPNRELENLMHTHKYPDYYYDLSRKSREHLLIPFWIIPKNSTETVTEARERLLNGLPKIITGEPFLRPLICNLPSDPIPSMLDSCNRGGNTFILNHKAILETPNSILTTNEKENRRSDMIWAIINRYYHKLTIKKIDFPLHHHRSRGAIANFSLEKTLQEIRGAALYAGLESFLTKESYPSDWIFKEEHVNIVFKYYSEYLKNRISGYSLNFIAIREMLDTLQKNYSHFVEVPQFIERISPWVQPSNLELIRTSLLTEESKEEVSSFIKNLRVTIQNFSNL